MNHSKNNRKPSSRYNQKWDWENGWSLVSAFQDFIKQDDLIDFWNGSCIQIENCRHCDKHMNSEKQFISNSLDNRQFIWNNKNNELVEQDQNVKFTVKRSPVYKTAFRLYVQKASTPVVCLAMDIESKSMMAVSEDQLQVNHLVDFHFQITKQLFSSMARKNPGWSEGLPQFQIQWFVHPPLAATLKQRQQQEQQQPQQRQEQRLPKLFVMENLSLGAEWETREAQHFVVNMVRCSPNWIDWVLNQYDSLTGPCCTESYDGHFWTEETCAKVLTTNSHHCEKLVGFMDRLPETEKRALKHIQIDRLYDPYHPPTELSKESRSSGQDEEDSICSKDENNPSVSGWIIVGVILIVILILSLFVFLYYIWNGKCKTQLSKLASGRVRKSGTGSVSIIYLDEQHQPQQPKKTNSQKLSKKKTNEEDERLFDGDSHHVF